MRWDEPGRWQRDAMGPAQRRLTSVQGLAAVLAEDRKPRSRLAEELSEPWDSRHSMELPLPSPPSRTDQGTVVGTVGSLRGQRSPSTLLGTALTCPGGLPPLSLPEGPAGAAGGTTARCLHAQRQGLAQLQLRLLG